MSNFLVNLVQRGAGLGPWTAVGPPAAKPDFIATSFARDNAENRWAARFEDPDQKPLGEPILTLVEQPITHEVEERSEHQSSDTQVGIPFSIEDRTGSVAPLPGRNAPTSVMKSGLSDDLQPSVSLKPLQASNQDARHHRVEVAEPPPEKTVRILSAPEQLDRHHRLSDNPEAPTAYSALRPQEPAQDFSGKPLSLPGTIVGGEPETIAQSGNNIRPPVIHLEERFFLHADRIGNEPEASSIRISRSPSSTHNNEKAESKILPKNQAEVVNQKPRIFAGISESHRQLMAAVKAASAAIPRNGARRPEYPLSDPPVQVRIGRVEVSAAPVHNKVPRQPSPPVPKGGFGEYYAMRNYIFPEF